MNQHMNIVVHSDFYPSPDFWPEGKSRHPTHNLSYVRDKRGLRVAKMVSRFIPHDHGQNGRKVAVSPCATAFVLLSTGSQRKRF